MKKEATIDWWHSYYFLDFPSYVFESTTAPGFDNYEHSTRRLIQIVHPRGSFIRIYPSYTRENYYLQCTGFISLNIIFSRISCYFMRRLRQIYDIVWHTACVAMPLKERKCCLCYIFFIKFLLDTQYLMLFHLVRKRLNQKSKSKSFCNIWVKLWLLSINMPLKL